MSQEDAFQEVLRVRNEIHAEVGNEHQIQHWLDEFEKAVLHEAAEKIRDELDPNRNPMFLSDFDEGLTHGADLIDPYAS